MFNMRDVEKQAIKKTKEILEADNIKPELTEEWLLKFYSTFFGVLAFILVDTYGLPKEHVFEKIEEIFDAKV